ncbi:uncharacterized protein LOC144909796 isoform X1 [Branchiostoma floridae x Branchiostoma belcheri]
MELPRAVVFLALCVAACLSDHGEEAPNVRVRPAVLVYPENVTIAWKETATFKCQATGNPPPAIFWYKEGSQILHFPGKTTGRLRVSNSGELIIRRVSNEDQGWYVCKALSVSGSVTGKTYLRVDDSNRTACEEMVIPMCVDLPYSLTSYPNFLGHASQATASAEIMRFHPLAKMPCSPDILSFICTLYAPPCDKKTADGTALPPCREFCQSSRQGCENLMNKFGFQWPRQLECSRFPEENTSNGCISKDTMVPAEVTLLPVINNEPARPPHISPTFPKKLIVGAGKDFSLFCEADGNPEPRVRWRRQNTTLYLDNPLTFKELDYVEEGTYECVASSYGFADVTREIFINVQGRPVVRLGGSSTLIVREGDTAIMVCEVLADPSPYVIWVWRDEHGGEKVLSEKDRSDRVKIMRQELDGVTTSVLTVYSIRLHQAGDYVCKATNSFGSNELTVTLEMKERKTRTREPIYIPACRDLQYNLTTYPNILGHRSQEEARVQLYKFAPLLNVRCSPELKYFLCNVYTPPYDTENGAREVIPPCRPLCETSRADCARLMNKFGFPWPEQLQCSRFPLPGGSERCINRDRLVASTAVAAPPLTVLVKAPPTIQATFGDYIHARSGQTFQLDCVAEGNPKPAVMWRRKGTEEYFKNPLAFSKVEYTAEGAYECVASSPHFPEAIKETYIDVKGKPEVDLEGPQTVRAREGSTVSLTCRVTADPPTDYPAWFANGREVNPEDNGLQGWEVIYETDQGKTRTTLFFGNVTSRHAAVYTCRATNKFGYGQKTFDMRIQDRSRKCDDLTVPLCQGLDYNSTRLPNALGHATQEQVAREAHQFWPLVEIECSPFFRSFLCSVFAPPCHEDSPDAVPPCKEMCESSYSSCAEILRQYGLSWPDSMNCSQFPSYYGDQECSGWAPELDWTPMPDTAPPVDDNAVPEEPEQKIFNDEQYALLGRALPTCEQLVDCNLDCEYGPKFDENQCPICECGDNPCKETSCGEYEVCALQPIQCLSPPCSPLPYCKPVPFSTNAERQSIYWLDLEPSSKGLDSVDQLERFLQMLEEHNATILHAMKIPSSSFMAVVQVNSASTVDVVTAQDQSGERLMVSVRSFLMVPYEDYWREVFGFRDQPLEDDADHEELISTSTDTETAWYYFVDFILKRTDMPSSRLRDQLRMVKTLTQDGVLLGNYKNVGSNEVRWMMRIPGPLSLEKVLLRLPVVQHFKNDVEVKVSSYLPLQDYKSALQAARRPETPE